MTNLDSLRARVFDGKGWNKAYVEGALIHDLWTEIERLEKANAQMLEHGREMWAENKALRNLTEAERSFDIVWSLVTERFPYWGIANKLHEDIVRAACARSSVEPTVKQCIFRSGCKHHDVCDAAQCCVPGGAEESPERTSGAPE